MIKQRSEEWFKQRVSRVTGSRAGAILGLSPYQSREDVLRAMVREYHGAPSEFTGNVATAYGQANELNALLAYEIETGDVVKECGFFPYEDWLGASPDGIVNGSKTLETKCPYSLRNGGVYKTLAEQPHYYAQKQIEMFCTKLYQGDFVQWSPVLPIYIEHVSRDEIWLRENLPRLEEFHQLYLSELSNPEHLEPLRKVITNMEAHKLVDEYAELKDAIDRATERQEDIMSELVEYSGGRNALIGSNKLTKVERKGSVAYAKIVKKELPDLDLKPYTGKPSTYWTLS